MPTQAAEYLEAILHLPAGSTLIVHDVSWAEYEQLLEEMHERPSARVSYDDGRLEVVTTSGRHERIKELVLRLAEILATDSGRPLESYGGMTMKVKELKRGDEPDTCFYVQHAAEVTGLEEIRLGIDPPPDVLVEVDVKHSSTRKLAFYAQLGVPEIWRYDGIRMRMLRLSGTAYDETPSSLAFPRLTADTLTALLARLRGGGQQAILDDFRRSLQR